MLRIHEFTKPDGQLATVSLEAAEGASLRLVTEGESLAVPPGALEAVMERYGAPLDATERVVPVGELALEAAKLRHVRHLARYDVIARDYLVFERPDREPVCVLATTVAGALAHIARLV